MSLHFMLVVFFVSAGESGRCLPQARCHLMSCWRSSSSLKGHRVQRGACFKRTNYCARGTCLPFQKENRRQIFRSRLRTSLLPTKLCARLAQCAQWTSARGRYRDEMRSGGRSLIYPKRQSVRSPLGPVATTGPKLGVQVQRQHQTKFYSRRRSVN